MIMKKAEGPNWQVIILIAAIILLVVMIAFSIVMQDNLEGGANIIRNLLG